MAATLLVFTALLASAAAGPVRVVTERSDSCATSCTPSQKFRYEPGRTYSYDYTVQTETSMDGASEDKALITINGQADIEVITQCDLVLRLRGMNVLESNIPSPDSEEFRRTLEQSPLRFSFQDGVVAELCPERGEDRWALNVKRGVLSALQNSMDKLEGTQTVQETDVSGRCQAKYEVTEKGWYSTTIKRSKDLLACTDRHGYSGSLQTTPYHVASELQSLPLMKSEHECEQLVSSKGVLQSSKCTEQHLFRPFSAEGSGAVTSVTQSLKYRSDRPGVSSGKDQIQSRAEMHFDHSYDVGDSTEVRARAESLLNKLCEVTLSGVKPEVPRLFSQLVSVVRNMDASDIREINSMLQRQAICSTNNDRTKKFFLDALPMAGTSVTVSQMAQLMVDGQVSGLELDLWLASLAFIPEPTSDMLSAVQPLLSSDKLKQQAMLPVSAMVNNFCKTRGDTCGDEPSVQSIMTALQQGIGYNCYVTDSSISSVLLSLKALGNTGLASAAPLLARCLTSRLPTEVRVEAANAFRRIPCDSDKSKLLSLLRDVSEDSELRISAYLQLMACPSKSLLTNIQAVMQGEADDSQVGSFMYTHLTNLMETSSPHKQDVRQMVSDLHLNKQFQLNPLKFSRNYEKSLFLKMFNTGAEGESNVIFSSKSSLPRSLSANLTFDLFGHSVNLLELGGRLEGIEYLLETVLGPYSFFGDGTKNFAKDKLDELKGSMYARIFGNELAYTRFQGLTSLTSGKTFNLLDFLIKLSKDHDYSFTQSVQFLESSLTVPTASGLPLTLYVNATATVDIRAAGKMDLRKVQTSPRSIQVDGELRPSGAVNIDAVMSVDALVAKSGLKVSGSLSSNVALKGRVDLDRGRVLSVQLDMPDDRQDILDIRTQFFIQRSGEEKEQKMITDNRKELQLCTGDMVSRMTGLQLCGELQFPNASMQSSGPYFPLTGPASLSLVLHKRDSHTGYKLLAKRVENKHSSIAQLSFDTPGSSVVRAVSFDMMVDYGSQEAEISFASPWKKSTVKGSIVNEAGLKSVTGSIVMDDTDVYSVTSEVKAEDKDKVIVYTPFLEIRRPGADPISLKGSAEVEAKYRTLSTDMTLAGVTQDPIQLQATYTNTQSEKSVKGTVTRGKDQYKAQAGMTYEVRSGKAYFAQFEPVILVSSPRGELVSVGGIATYREGKDLKAELNINIPDVMDKPISIKSSVTQKNSKRGPEYVTDLRVMSRPFSTKINGFISQRNGLQQARLTIEYNLLRMRDRIQLNSKLSDKSTDAYRKYSLASNVDFKSNPNWNVDLNLGVDHKMKRSEGEMIVRLGKDRKDKSQQLVLSGAINHKISSPSQVGFDFTGKAFAPMLGIDTSFTGDHSHSPDNLNSKVSVTYAKDSTVTAEVNLLNKTDDKMKLQSGFSLSFPGGKYQLASQLSQKKADQYEHTLDIMDAGGDLASITTTYKTAKDDSREASSVIIIRNLKAIKVSGSTSLELDNLRVEGQLTHGDDGYGLLALSKVSRGTRGKWTLEAYNPRRKVSLNANAGMQKGGMDMDMDLAWDKDRDNDAKVTLAMSGKHKSQSGVISTSGKLDFTSPFRPLPYLSAALTYDSDNQRYGLDSKVSVGDKDTTYSSTFNVPKPVSPRDFHLTWTGSSPHKGFQRMEASLDHVMDDTSVKTSAKVSKGRSDMVFTITATNNGRGNQRDLKGDVTFKSGIEGLEDMSGYFSHSDDGRKFTSSVGFLHYGEKYSADLDMTHFRRDWQVQNNGQVKLGANGYDLTTNWQHRNTDSDVRSSLTSVFNRQQLKVELTGSANQRSVTGTVKVQSPWERVRDLNVNVNHEMGTGSCKHSCVILYNGKKIASTGLNYNMGDKSADLDLSLTSPFHDDISGKASSQFQDYPETAHLEFTWSPLHTITTDASIVSKDNDDGIEGNLRLTTTFTDPANVVLKGSLAREGEELVTKASVDYGVRKTYDLEGRLRLESLSLARIRINTPLSDLSSLDTGYQFTGDSDDFDASADFSLTPILGKYTGVFSWDNDDDMTAKARLTTPHTSLQYVQMTATSQETPQGRQSRVELDYYPRQIYSVQSLYSLAAPIVFSIHIDTPIAGYNSFSAAMSHKADTYSIKTNGQIQYLPGRMIDGTLDLSWDRDINGNLVLKTPFSKYEESKLSVRHEGDLNDFTSHAQVDVARQTVSADAKFKTGYSSSGSMTVRSPWRMLEAMFTKTGNSDNFRSSGSLAYGDQKIEGALTHRFSDSMLKTKVTLSTPFTQELESSIDYMNRNGNVQADISGKYGKNVIKSENKGSLSLLDSSADTTLTYRLGGATQVMKAGISKKGDWDNVELSATASSPYTENMGLSVKHSLRLPYSLQNTVTATYGPRFSVVSDATFDYRQPDITSSYSLQYTLDAPPQEISVTLSRRGDLDNMKLDAALKTPFRGFESTGSSLTYTGKYNGFSAESSVQYMTGQKITAIVSKSGTMDNFNVNAALKTPLPGFESMGATMTYTGKDQGFSTDGTVEYMTGQKIQHNITLDYNGWRRLQLDASLTSPISGLERTSVGISHNYDGYNKACTGSAQIQSEALGDHQISYKLSGDLDSMTVDMNVVCNGRTTQCSITRVPLTNGYKHAIQIVSPSTKLDAAAEYEVTGEKISGKASASTADSSLSAEGEASVSGRQAGIVGKVSIAIPILQKTASISLTKDGYLDNFGADFRGSYDSQEATAHAEFKNEADQLSGKLSVKTPVQGFTNIGAAFNHKGDLGRFDCDGKLTYMDGQDIGGKVTFYRYQLRRIEVTGELTTPFSGLRSTKAEYRHQGSADSFTCAASLQYGNSQKMSADLRASVSPKYDMSLTVKTPYRVLSSLVAQATLDSVANTHSLKSSLDLGRGQRFSVTGSLDMDSVPMTASAQLATPYDPVKSLEISGSHQGQIDDFSSNLVFNSPLTDTIRGDVSVKYVSPLEASLSMGVKSGVTGLEDLLLEAKNTQSGDSMTSHVATRWAPGRQITVDGTLVRKVYRYNKELTADLSLTTPFNTLTSSSVHLEYSDTNNKYTPKAQLTANGQTLLDIDGEYTHGDNPAATLTTRKPWPMQLTASIIGTGASKEGDLYVNWNRDALDQNVRIHTKGMNVKDDDTRNMDYSVKVTHKSRVMSAGAILSAGPTKVTSEGHVAWDQRDDTKISFLLDLNDDSQSGRKNMKGSAKLGLPRRTLQATGVVSAYRQISSVEGTFAWDAAIDPTKEVGILAKVTSGDKTKADVTFKLPGKELRIDSEMTVRDGRTVWDGKTALSYSPDTRKTITLSSSLKDVSNAYNSDSKNYSLSLAVSHPYTDVFVSLTSHLGTIGDRYSTAMDIQYLTASRQRKVMAVRGEIDRLRRQIDLQLMSPLKKMALQGKIQSTDPYILTLSNTVDDQSTMLSEININPTARSLTFQTNYDLSSPDTKLVLKAGYVNDSAVRAELTRESRYNSVSESVVAVRLNTSRLLHTRLAWRPDMLADMQMYGRRQTYDLATKAKATLQDVIEAVGQEVSAKYTAIADEFSSELRPLVDVLRSELFRLGQQLEAIIKETNQIQAVQKLGEELSKLSKAYQRSYTSILSSMYGQLETLKRFPIKQKYQEAVAELIVQAEALIDQGMTSLSRNIANLDDYLWQITNGAQQSWAGITNHPRVQNMKQRVELLGSDYRWLLGHLGERVQQFSVPEQYTNAIYDARNTISSGLDDMLDSQQIRKVKDVANEVYQQGAWAYKYWRVEENIQRHLASIVQLAKQLVAQEMEVLTEKLDFLRKSRVTVYDPEHGELQAEIVLPIPVESFKDLPDIQSYMDQAQDTVDDYLPSKDAMVDFYNKYAPSWGNNDTMDDKEDIALQFEKYQPERPVSVRRPKKGKNSYGFAAYRL